jgi:hypothetical protein
MWLVAMWGGNFRCYEEGRCKRCDEGGFAIGRGKREPVGGEVKESERGRMIEATGSVGCLVMQVP